MASEMLSQDEIDALLKQGGSDDDDSPSGGDSLDDYISPIEQDALGEIGNITFGSASTALSTLLGQKVDITTPSLSPVRPDRYQEKFPEPHVAIHVNYTVGFEGANVLVIGTRDAAIIADLMLGGDGKSPDEELSEMHLSAVQEAMNQMMGSAATSMSTIFNRKVDISPPGIDIFNPEQDSPDYEEILVEVSFRMKIGDLIDSNIMQLIPVSFAKTMVQLLMNPEASGSDATATEAAPPQPQATQAQPTQQQMPMQENPMHQQAMQQQPMQQQPMYQQPMYDQQMYQQPPMYQQPHAQSGQQNMVRSANVQPVQFSPLDQQQQQPMSMQNLNLLLDIPLNVTVELGRTKRLIKEILELSPGSILELDKLAGEPVDILVNNKIIAKGEVVVIEENFGVRVTDILSQWDRLQKLQ